MMSSPAVKGPDTLRENITFNVESQTNWTSAYLKAHTTCQSRFACNSTAKFKFIEKYHYTDMLIPLAHEQQSN